MQAISAPLKLAADDPRQVIDAAAVDSDFFGHYFFPKTCSMESPQFHKIIWDTVERPENRYVAVEVFREGAKTSLIRLFAAKRISYGQSFFIAFVSKSEKHSVYSVDWLRRNVLHNRKWAQTFQLTLKKKAEKEIEIIHGATGKTIRVVALGMTGQLRGFNVDDDRFDLIVADDLDDLETAGSETQREKQQDLLFGALLRSLVARTANPHAKALILQTPHDREDLIRTAAADPSFVHLQFGCFDEKGKSRWPARHPTEDLLREKSAYMGRNQLSLWMREMECQIVPKETRTFRVEWLQKYEVLPEDCYTLMTIDPATSDREDAADQAVAVIGVRGPAIYLITYELNRGQSLAELAANVFRLFSFWKPIQVGVETIAYQKVCAWYLREESHKRGIYLPIHEIQDRQPKDARIIDAITSVAATGNLYIREHHHEFIRDYGDFPAPSRKDLLDCIAMAIKMRNPAIAAEPLNVYQGRLTNSGRLIQPNRSCP